MIHLRILLSKISGLFRKSRLEQQLDDEVRSHLDMLVEENRRKGMTAEEARYAALRQFGNVSSMKEECRETWSVRFIEELVQDIRYGLRQFRRNPGFTTVVVLTLALGIGANTAIFSVVNAVMLKTLPVKNPEQLLHLSWVSQEWPADLLRGSDPLMRDATGRWTGLSFPYPTFEEFQRDNSVFSSFFGFDPFGSVNISAVGRANVAEEELVTGDYFSGLGVAPTLGRFIDREDEKFGAPGVVVISYGLWSRYFGRSLAAVGKGITINGASCRVIGVAPPQFSGVTPGRAVDVWVPIVQNTRLLPPILLHMPGESSPFTSKTSWWVEMMGRLKPGVTSQEAQAQLEVLFQQSRRGLNADAKPRSIPHIQLESGAKGLASLREEFSRPLRILTVIVGIVLLIACANVAALLLARSAARQQEIALRLSLGTSRARLVRQLLTESVLLAGLGGAAGVLFAHWASHALVLLMSSGGQPLNLNVQLDTRVLGFTAAVSIVTGILFGLAPALRFTRADLTPALKAGSGGTSPSGKRAQIGLARSLVATQVALALLLSIGAGLFVRTLEALEGQNIGFDQHHLLLFTIDPERNGYEGERLMDFYARLCARLQALPGVNLASMSMERPVYGNEWSVNVPVSVDGYKPDSEHSISANWNTVGPSFFETLGIPLMVGRNIELSDTAASLKVVVVNEAFAREAFGGRNPIGHRVRFPFQLRSEPEFEIVGMVQDARYASLRGSPRPTIYIPYTQLPAMLGPLNFELRTTGDSLAFVPAVRSVVRDLDPEVPISNVRTQTQQIAETLMQERLFSRLSSFFGGLVVLLACVGLFGVISYSVNQRTHEIGIRMVLGAEKRDVLRMVIGQGLRLALIGVAIGIAGALALTRFLSSLLYGVKPTDPLTFIAVSLILIAVALVACYIPARRAAKVDPMVALRYE